MSNFIRIEFDEDAPTENVTQWMQLNNETVNLLENVDSLCIIPLNIYVECDSYDQLVALDSKQLHTELNLLGSNEKLQCTYAIALFVKNIYNTFPMTLEWRLSICKQTFVQSHKPKTVLPSNSDSNGYTNLLTKHVPLTPFATAAHTEREYMTTVNLIGFQPAAVEKQFLMNTVSLDTAILRIPKSYPYCPVIRYATKCVDKAQQSVARERKTWYCVEDQKYLKLSLPSFRKVVTLLDNYIDLEAISRNDDLTAFAASVSRFDEEPWCMDSYHPNFKTSSSVSAHLKAVICFTSPLPSTKRQ